MTAFKMARSLTSERKRAARMLKGNMSVITDTGGLYCLPQTTRTLLMRLKSTGLTCIDFKKGNHESQLGHKALTVNNDMCDFFHKNHLHHVIRMLNVRENFRKHRYMS